MTSSKFLRIDCSPTHGRAASSSFADELLSQLQAQTPGATTLVRNLAAEPPGFVDVAFVKDMKLHPTTAIAATVRSLQTSERLIEELTDASVVIIATPMHNYTVPAVLKAWID